MNDKEEIKRDAEAANPPVIGIYGTDALVAADLFDAITRMAESDGALLDQDHPNVVVYTREFNAEAYQKDSFEQKLINSRQFDVYEGTKTLKRLGATFAYELSNGINELTSNDVVTSRLDLLMHDGAEPMIRPKDYDKFIKDPKLLDGGVQAVCEGYSAELQYHARMLLEYSKNPEAYMDENVRGDRNLQVVERGLAQKSMGDFDVGGSLSENISIFRKVIHDGIYLPSGRVGVVGGMGPAAGGVAFRKTIDESEARKNIEVSEGKTTGKVAIMLSSLSGLIPSRVDYMNFKAWEEYSQQDRTKGDIAEEPIVPAPNLIAGKYTAPPSPVDMLAKIVIGMNRAHVDDYIMACNTVHGMLAEVDEHIHGLGVGIAANRVSIIDELVRSMPSPTVQKFGNHEITIPMGMMATTTTRQFKLYTNAAKELGRTDLEFVYPDMEISPGIKKGDKDLYNNYQELCHQGVIFDGVKAGDDKKSQDFFESLLVNLRGQVTTKMLSFEKENGIGEAQKRLLQASASWDIIVVGGCSEISVAHQLLNDKKNAGRAAEDHEDICKLVDSVDYGVGRMVANAHFKKHRTVYNPVVKVPQKAPNLVDVAGKPLKVPFMLQKPIKRPVKKTEFLSKIIAGSVPKKIGPKVRG